MKITFILFFISITWHAWAQRIEIYKPQQPVSTGSAATSTANTKLQTTVVVSSPRLTQPLATRRANAVVVQPKVATRVDPPRMHLPEKGDGDSPGRRDLYCYVLNAKLSRSTSIFLTTILIGKPGISSPIVYYRFIRLPISI